MATGLFTIMSVIGTWSRSIAAGITERPSIDYKYDPNTGELSVIIPKNQVQPKAVKLRHAETFSTERRDFRWAVQANNFTKIDPACKPPYIPYPKKK